MNKLLITGFVPFGKFKVNPSEEIVKKLLKNPPLDYDCEGYVLPIHSKYVYELFRKIKPCKYSLIIGLGLNEDVNKFTIETTAKNKVIDYDFREKTGHEKLVPIFKEDGFDNILKNPLPLKSILAHQSLENFPIKYSDDAGCWLCNMIYYVALKSVKQCDHTSVLFIHLPKLTDIELEKQIKFIYIVLEKVRIK